MSWLVDPRLFNWLIVAMFVGASIRWAIAGNIPQAGYWASAAVLNVFVTLMAK